MKIFDYKITSFSISTSFDYGEVEAENLEQAIVLAKEKINKDVDKANELLGGYYSVDIDTDEIEVEERFDLDGAVLEFMKELEGKNFNGLTFNVDPMMGTGYLAYSNEVANEIGDDIVFYGTPFFNGNKGVEFQMMNNGGKVTSSMVPCRVPDNAVSFERFKKFYIAQLHMVESKFAKVNKVTLDKERLEYTIEGFLVPKQTIKFDTYSDWDSIESYTGNPLFDCQIDMDEDLGEIVYQFQYMDLNYDVDEKTFNVDDTPKFGGGYINRDYRWCKVTQGKTKPDMHPLTKKLLDSFLVTNDVENGFGSDEVIEDLNRFFRNENI
jgi:hypothetical protein